jgi:dihydrofolate synthase / folylpolyglutamate synthase
MGADDGSRAARLLAQLYRQGEFKIKLGLEPMRAALAACGEPQSRFPSVLVAGTNGKGSVSALLAAAAQSVGLRVGLYTSPHLIHVAERVRVNGRPLDEAPVLALIEAVLHDFGEPEAGAPDTACGLIERTQPVTHRLTFFELTTLVALLAFARQRCDIAVLEVGMGGRLDATNATSPCLSVITSLSLDHQAYLGDTIEAIAGEKAGILRAGVPAILGSRAAQSVLTERASAIGAPAWRIGVDFDITQRGDRWSYWGPAHTLDVTDHPWVQLAHSRDNLAIAIAAATALTAPSLPLASHTPPTLLQGMTRARWPGRFWALPQEACARIGARGVVLLDAAHNPGGAQALADALQVRYPGRPWVWVAAAMADKDIEGLCAPLLSCPTLRDVFVSPLQTPRGESPVRFCARAGLPPERAARSLVEALRLGAARAQALDGLLVIAGSIYLLGEVLQAASVPWTDLITYEQRA